MLTDLEYRVWTQYLLTADDFGVMHATAVALQNANIHLANRPAKLIKRSLDVLIKTGLVHRFEHQGQAYVFQQDWQRWQKVEYPRATINPAPADDDLAACEDSTRVLFAKYPGGQRKDRRRADDVPSHSEHASQISPENIPPTHARTSAERLTANGLRLTASPDAPPKRNPAALVDGDIADRGAELIESYQGLYAKHRNGAHYRPRPNLDWVDACDLCRHWTDARLEKLAVIVLTTDDSWIAGTDRSFAIFAKKATWADDKLCAWEREHGVAV